jgi:hypothetical protein
MTIPDEDSFMGWTKGDPFIFVSYARENSNFVYPEIERLKAEGYKIWYDKEQIRPSHLWSNEINEALEACSCFLVFIAKRAVESERVICEIRQALSLKKPLIVIYWQKVKLPPDLQSHLQEIQALEFYDLHRPSYESQLGRALAESIRPPEPRVLRQVQFNSPKPPSGENKDDLAPVLEGTAPQMSSGISPKLIFFILILLGVAFTFLSIIVAVVPFFGSPVPGDPLANHWAGFAAGSLFLMIAVGLYLAAFAVYRKYLRRK